jgi:hypothetical protein
MPVCSVSCKPAVDQRSTLLQKALKHFSIRAVRDRIYLLGLFRHFSKFDNHVKTPFECDLSVCLLARYRGSIFNVHRRRDTCQRQKLTYRNERY